MFFILNRIFFTNNNTQLKLLSTMCISPSFNTHSDDSRSEVSHN